MKRILLLLCCALLSWSACGVEVAGVKVADTAQVGGAPLQLNGAGVRTKVFLKIYVAALYLPQKQTSADAVLAEEREHSIALHILRELSGKKMFSAFRDAIEANHSSAEMSVLAPQVKQMEQIFDSVREVKPGDIITLDYTPAGGTQIGLNGTALGTIVGTTFNRALLKIWLGKKPAQGSLKKELLGG